MGITTRLAALSGSVLLVAAGLAVLGGIGALGTMLLGSVTAGRLLTMLASFGAAVVLGSTGVFVRKMAAGTVLPLDIDRSSLSVVERGG